MENSTVLWYIELDVVMLLAKLVLLSSVNTFITIHINISTAFDK